MTGMGCGGCGEGRELAGGHSAVYGDYGAGDEGCFVGGEPDYGLGDLLGVAHAADGRFADHPVLNAGVGIDDAADHRGVGVTRAHGVDAYAFLGVFKGGDPGQTRDAMLAGGVGRGVGGADDAVDGCEVDYRAATLV